MKLPPPDRPPVLRLALVLGFSVVLSLFSSCTTATPSQLTNAKRVGLMIDPRISNLEHTVGGLTKFREKTSDLHVPGWNFESFIRASANPSLTLVPLPYSEPKRHQVTPDPGLDLICCFTARETMTSGFYDPVSGVYVPIVEKRASIMFREAALLKKTWLAHADVLFDCEVFEGATGRRLMYAVGSHLLEDKSMTPEAVVTKATGEAVKEVLIATKLARPGLSSEASQETIRETIERANKEYAAGMAQAKKEFKSDIDNAISTYQSDMTRVKEKFRSDMAKNKAKFHADMARAKAERGPSNRAALTD